MTRDIKVIAIDLDGTLLNSDHEISPRTARVLKQAMAQGVQVILATGKTSTSREKPVRQLGLNTPGVYSQGLVLVNADGSVRFERTMDPAAARTVIAYAEAHDTNLIGVVASGTRILANRASTLTEFVITYHEPVPDIVGPLSRLPAEMRFNKLVIEADPALIPALKTGLADQLNGSAELVRSMPQLLEVLPAGASKGDGLRRLLDEMGIDPQDVMALGDADNDLEMLAMVRLGVAMGNANDHVKAVADFVTGSNDEDGVAEAVERFVLN